MDRRAFLGTLFASLGVAAVDPSLLWQPARELGLPPLEPLALVTLKDITREILQELAKRLDGSRHLAMTPPPSTFPEGFHQFNVCCMPPSELGEAGLDRERFILPIAEAFAAKIRYEHMNTFVRLPLPLASDAIVRAHEVADMRSGLSVRGVEASYYDLELDQWVNRLRFDVMGGRT